MMMSALPVCRLGMRVAPMVGTTSSSTPRSLASSSATSSSEPVGFMVASIMPDGGIARSVEMRIFLASRMSSSRSACAPAKADAARRPAASARRRQ